MSASGSPIVAISQSSTAPGARGPAARRSCFRAGSRRARSSPGRDSGRFSASQRADRFDGRDLARPVELPQAAEAPQLALEVAGGLAEVLEPGGPPVDRVDLHERVDQLLGDPPALLGVVQRGGNARDDHLARRPAPSRRTARRSCLVGADGEHPRHACGRAAQRAQQARLAKHVVRARRQRRARRAAQHELAAAALDQVGDVRVALSDRRGPISPSPRPCASRNSASGSSTSSGGRLVGRALGGGRDDVVGGDLRTHGANAICCATRRPARRQISAGSACSRAA